MAISLNITFDERAIMRIITSPCLWDKIAQDGALKDNYVPSMNDLWLMLKCGDEVAGVYVFDNLRGVSCDIHPYVLPEHRIKSARDGLALALNYLFSHFDRIHKVNAMIPIIYKSVYNFAINSGFTSEGISRQSFMKNGEIHDQYIVGITRKEAIHVSH